MSAKLDLQALIDMRGAGNAQKELIKAGAWNSAASNDPDDKIFKVTLKGTATWEKTITVWAKNADDAEDKAWDMDFDVNDHEIDDIEVTDADAEEE